MSLTSLIAVFAVFTFGMVVVFPGSIKLRLAQRLSMTDTHIGRLIMAWQVSTMLGTLLVGPLLDRFGHRLLLVAGFLIVAAAIGLFASARSAPTAFVAAIVLGLGGSCVNAGGNTLLPTLNQGNPAAASNLGNVFFGVGAFVVPFLASFLFGRIGFPRTLAVFSAAAALLAIPAAIPSYPRIPSGFEFAVALRLLASPVVLVAGLMLFCYIGLEVSAASWTTTYLKHAGFDEKQISLVFSFFWLAMMLGRLAASQWVTTAIGRAAIQAFALAAALVLLLMTFRTVRWVASTSVILLGLFFAPLFPTIAGVTFAHFNPSLYGSVFAIIFSLGLLGSSIVPAAIGAVSEKRSIRAGYRIMVVLALVLFLVAFGL
jgi:FHS family glucose/mannose:H+ symporter-like MFS transporter